MRADEAKERVLRQAERLDAELHATCRAEMERQAAQIERLTAALEALAHEWDSQKYYANYSHVFGQQLRATIAAALASGDAP